MQLFRKQQQQPPPYTTTNTATTTTTIATTTTATSATTRQQTPRHSLRHLPGRCRNGRLPSRKRCRSQCCQWLRRHTNMVSWSVSPSVGRSVTLSLYYIYIRLIVISAPKGNLHRFCAVARDHLTAGIKSPVKQDWPIWKTTLPTPTEIERFLVAYKRLYKSLCWLLGPSISLSVTLYFFQPKGNLTSVNAPSQRTRLMLSCIRPCCVSFSFRCRCCGCCFGDFSDITVLLKTVKKRVFFKSL